MCGRCVVFLQSKFRGELSFPPFPILSVDDATELTRERGAQLSAAMAVLAPDTPLVVHLDEFTGFAVPSNFQRGLGPNAMVTRDQFRYYCLISMTAILGELAHNVRMKGKLMFT